MTINKKTHISIISPVYKAENIIEQLVAKINQSVSLLTDNFEIILVNDCSPDNSWVKILQESKKDSRVKGINLSRNFGQHLAITAGLNYAKGDWIVVMDCDLQDRPDEIPNLYKKALAGWDIVYARRFQRQDKLSKRISSKLFYWVYGYMSGVSTDKSIANFGIYHAKVIIEYNKMKELSRSFPSLVQSLGFKSCAINVKHSERFEGSSSYTFLKLLHLSGDVIISNSNKPLKIAIKLGFSISIFSFLIAFYNTVAYFAGVITVAGFTTTVFSIWFVGGLNLTLLGILGLYIGKIFNQVKGRQLFIVSDEINIQK
jgi:glycosyltransferase involved in cell wall biosynthesis